MKKEDERKKKKMKKEKKRKTRKTEQKNMLFFIISSFFCLFFSYFFHHFLLCTVCHLQQRTRRRETEEEIFFACQRAPLHKEKKTKTVQFCNQRNRAKTGSTAPVRGFYGRTGGFRFLAYFSNFPVFSENQTGLDIGPRLNWSVWSSF